ncbi:hypothetical protein RJ55_04368 [Drechmeria coniospora]|nr:hypothetical protein RJ55_04368 [Drechmeria coniospora]
MGSPGSRRAPVEKSAGLEDRLLCTPFSASHSSATDHLFGRSHDGEREKADAAGGDRIMHTTNSRWTDGWGHEAKGGIAGNQIAGLEARQAAHAASSSGDPPSPQAEAARLEMDDGGGLKSHLRRERSPCPRHEYSARYSVSTDINMYLRKNQLLYMCGAQLAHRVQGTSTFHTCLKYKYCPDVSLRSGTNRLPCLPSFHALPEEYPGDGGEQNKYQYEYEVPRTCDACMYKYSSDLHMEYPTAHARVDDGTQMARWPACGASFWEEAAWGGLLVPRRRPATDGTNTYCRWTTQARKLATVKHQRRDATLAHGSIITVYSWMQRCGVGRRLRHGGEK